MNDIQPLAEEPPAARPVLAVEKLPGFKELQARIASLHERMETGKTLIQEYRQQHGADNFKYLQHLQKLKKELAQALSQQDDLSRRQISFQSSVFRKAIAAFTELVAMNLRKEYDTPRHKEQEDLVRKYIQENEDLFTVLYMLEDGEG